MLLGDAKKINQVLMNLVGNAIKFTKKGEIVIGAETIKEDDNSASIKIFVKDSGIGIPESDLHTVFNRFKQVEGNIDRQYGGSGLGLFISSELVHNMSGKLDLSSKLGEGSEFSFILDFIKLEQTSHAREMEVLQNQTFDNVDFSGLKVLIAEDNELNQHFLSSLLKKFELNFEMANDGLEAITWSQKQKFDLILMDLQMPKCDGFQAARAIRGALNNPNQKTPIVACTASGLFNEKNEALEAGMEDVLSKPFSQKNFVEIICKHLNLVRKSPTDHLNFTSLFEMYDNDEEQILYMVHVFMDNVQNILDDLFEAFDSGNAEKIKAAAHKYKPSFGMVGLSGIQTYLLKLEQITKQNKINEKAMVLIESLRKEIPSAISQLKQTFNDESTRHLELPNSRR